MKMKTIQNLGEAAKAMLREKLTLKRKSENQASKCQP